MSITRCLHEDSVFVVVIFHNGKHHVQKRCYSCGSRFGQFYSKDKFVSQLLEVVDLREKVRESCDKCGSLEGTEIHHITYNPESISNLCLNCHRVITRMNTYYGSSQNTSLSIEQRLIIWNKFCKLPLHKIGVLNAIKERFFERSYT